MATNKQRRDAERLRLQRQLEERRRREAARKRATLIGSIVGTLIVITLVVVLVIVTTGGDDEKSAASKASNEVTSSAPSSAAACGQQQFPSQQARAAKGPAVSFEGVSITGATDLGGKPGVTSKATAAPSGLKFKDLVVGRGAAASPTSCVTVQYDGVLYKTGTEFDSSWSRGQLAQFPLTGVVPGFTQGIGGTKGVPPMKVGGRRIVILPAALGYGAQGSPPKIPANAPLVFVIDLTGVKAGA